MKGYGFNILCAKLRMSIAVILKGSHVHIREEITGSYVSHILGIFIETKSIYREIKPH